MANGFDLLDAAQKRNFKRLQKAFAEQTLWVGFRDDRFETATLLVVQDDGGGEEIYDDDLTLQQYMLQGVGDPDDLAWEFFGQMPEWVQEEALAAKG